MPWTAARLALPGFFLALSCAFLTPSARAADEATLLLTGARVWTGNPEQPRAAAVAIAGERILAVGTADDLARFRGPATRVLHLPDRFVAPGFIDNHTHFDRAGELILGVNLLDVSDEAGLARRVREARDRLPRGAWLVGGDWGAYALESPFHPHRSMIDPVTPDSPALPPASGAPGGR